MITEQLTLFPAVREELGEWTFTFVSADGTMKSATVTAESFLDARDIFLNAVGEHTSYIVTQ